MYIFETCAIWSRNNLTLKYKQFLTLNVRFFYLEKQAMVSVCNLMQDILYLEVVAFIHNI